MKKYSRPTIITEQTFETSALACGKQYMPQVGSHHFRSAYDTFTGHLGPGMGANSSMSPDQAGIGFGPGGTSLYYGFQGLCGNWVTSNT